MRNRFADKGWVETKKLQHPGSIYWDDLTVNDPEVCAHFSIHNPMHDNPEPATAWVVYLGEALGQLHTSVEEKQREYRRLENLTERIHGLECKLSNLPTCESHYA